MLFTFWPLMCLDFRFSCCIPALMLSSYPCFSHGHQAELDARVQEHDARGKEPPSPSTFRGILLWASSVSRTVGRSCETGSAKECKTSRSSKQTMVNTNTLFLAFPVRFRVVALDFNFKPVQEKVSDQ